MWELVQSVCCVGLGVCLLAVATRGRGELLSLIGLAPHKAAPPAAPPTGVCRRCGAMVYDPGRFSRSSGLCSDCIGQLVLAGARRGGRPRTRR